MSPLKILYQSSRCVAVDKPAGLLSVPGKGAANQDCAASRVAQMFPHATGPLTVHRLDMDTSGVLVFGLDPLAQRELSMQFERRSVEKAYTAVVASCLPRSQGTIDAPMRLDVERRPVQIIDPVHGKPAVTHFRVLESGAQVTRLELTPLTGRTHQLRLHLSHIGHPILGDPLYGPIFEQRTGADRLLLHAHLLVFDDPADGTRVRVDSAMPF